MQRTSPPPPQCVSNITIANLAILTTLRQLTSASRIGFAPCSIPRDTLSFLTRSTQTHCYIARLYCLRTLVRPLVKKWNRWAGQGALCTTQLDNQRIKQGNLKMGEYFWEGWLESIDEFRMVLGGQPMPFCLHPLSRVTRNCKTRRHQQLQI